MWGAHDGMGWWMLFGSIWWVIFVAAIVYLVVWASNRRTGGVPDGGDSALEIAKRRYARGEITKDEFDRLRQDLA